MLVSAAFVTCRHDPPLGWEVPTQSEHHGDHSTMSAPRPSRKNVRTVESAVRDSNAKILEWIDGARHAGVVVDVGASRPLRITLKHGPVEPKKLRDWTTQAIRKARAA